MWWHIKSRRTRNSRPVAEYVEPRILYSADLAGALLLGSGVDSTSGGEQRTLTVTGEYAPPAVNAASQYTAVPMVFEVNKGQAATQAEFIAHGDGYGVALAGGTASLTLGVDDQAQTVRLTLDGANAGLQGEAGQLMAGTSNYIIGSDPSAWYTNIATYDGVTYRDVYDGVDLRYYGNQRQLEYDFIVQAGADAGAIHLNFDGVLNAAIDSNGDLLLTLNDRGDQISFKAPVSYQDGASGREAVASRYQINADGSIGFALGAYDSARTLVIDPVLSYASYFGTSGTESGIGVAVDSSGAVYISGRTTSALVNNLGTPGGGDVFVAKFSADLSTLLYSTRVGGSNDEQGNAIAVDSTGAASVTGWTKSNDFPTASAIQGSRSGSQDAFVFRLNPAGNALTFSTYYGGTGGSDSGNAITVDTAGNIYVAGDKTQPATPVTISLGGIGILGGDDAFVTKLDSTGALQYVGIYGGGNKDYANGIAVDASGIAYIVGHTESSDLPMVGGNDTSYGGGGEDGFIAKVNAAGTSLLYSSFIGGGKRDDAVAVALSADGRAYVVGLTEAQSSSDFAVTAGAFQTSYAGSKTASFVRVYDTTTTGASSLLYSTFLGGGTAHVGADNGDVASGIAVNSLGQAYVVGETNSTAFPTTSGAYLTTNANGNMFLAVINPGGAGSADLVYGTYFGGPGSSGGVVAVGGTAVFVGTTSSNGFSTTGAARPTIVGGSDAIVAEFTITNIAPVLGGALSMSSILEGTTGGSGTLVSALIVGKIADPDPGALVGIAITGVDSSQGAWQYSTDGGTSWSAVGTPGNASALLLAADALTRVRFIPDAYFNGTVTNGLTFRAWDRSAGVAGSTADTTINGGSTAFSASSANSSIVVIAVNDAPGANADTLAATEDTPITYTAAQLLGNDTDVEGSALTVDSVTSGAGGTAVLNGNGTVTFTPNANFNGVASFSYTASDGAATSNSATATVNVAAVNDAPVANADTLAATEDTPITYTAVQLLGNDTDVEGDTLTVASVTSGAGGTAVLNGDGTVTFTPNANFNGAVSFTYTASDGALSSNSATATVNVAAVNDAPGANADTLAATEDTPITYTAAQLLGNDTDVEGSALTVDSVTSGAGGTAVLNGNGTVTFTPNANFNGVASFSYTASDGAATSNSATATVNVAAVNDAPVANADTLAATEGTPITYTAVQLLGNDTDVEGDTLTVASVTSGAGGTAVLNGDGTVTFTPNANFNGVASFSYTASDGAATSNSATATVNVAAVNDAPVANADTLAATEDTPITYTAVQLLGNDSDMEGDTLSIASVVSGSNGTVVLNGDGTVTFTPDANFNGVASFSYTASDGAATSNSATATVNVAAVNDAPVANADTLAATEDTPVTYTAAQLLGNDTDVEGSALTVDSVSGGAGGTAVLNGNGTVTFTPNANFNGVASFSYTASDGAATSNSATATVNVAAVNDAPVANADTLAATEDTPVTYTAAQLLGNDTDVEGSALTVDSVTSGAGGTAVLNGDGTVTFTPNANFNGVVSFSYTASDGAATSNSATVTVNVAAVNDAPVANADTRAATENTPVTYTAVQLLGNDADAEGDVLSIASVTSGIGGVAVLNGDGSVTFTPTPSFNGVASFTYTATDGWVSSNAATVTVNVTAVNNAPVANADTLAATEDTPITYTAAQLLGNDTDVDGDTLSIASVVSGSNGTVVLNGDGTVTFTPDANFNGVASFSYTASDGALNSNSATATVNVAAVNDAPVANADTLAATEDTPVTYTAAQLLGNDTDVEGDTLTVASVTSGAGGTAVLNGDGTVTFTPNANFNGAASFTYKASDGAATSNSATATVNVAAVNDAPVANADTLTATEDTPITYTAAQLLGNDSDMEGDTLSIASVVSGSNGTVVLNGDGTVTFTPDANFNGVASFSYTASDGALSSNSATATVNVAAVNDAPVANADTLAATEDTPVTYTAAQLLGNDTDVEGSALTVDSVTSGAGGTAVLNGNGTVTFTPNANFNGAASFTYTASDGALSSNSATATVNVAAVNDAPVANADTLAATEDTPVTYTAAQLLGNDTDVEGSALTVASVTSGAGGTAVLNGDGTVTFTPNANFNGAASFTYKASDGAATSNSATATVNVAAVNDAPVANADTLTETEDTPVTYTAAQLLGNDSDMEGDTLSIASVVSGSNGTVVLNGDGTVTFTPDANFNGVASFSYTASDGAATSNSATATVNVAAVNDAPVANADTLAATEDTPVTYTAAQLLGNDTDVEGSALTVDSVSGGAGGTAVLNGNGTVTFTPNANFNGVASFSYTASDGAATSNSATATVNVAAVNDAPGANADTLAATEDTPITYTAAQLLGNDTDVEGSALTVDSVTSGAGGTAVLNGNGTVTFTPNANFNGVASFSYTASDGAATSNSATATVNVAAVNDAPVANADTLAATEDTPITYTAVQLLGNDTDVEGDTLTVASVTSGAGGTAVLNGDGTVTFTPNANFNGVASFSYTASDGAATSNSATATVNVAAVNDAPVANADTLAATEDTPITYTAVQLLGNDSDMEGDTLSIASVVSGSNGTVVLNGDGTVTFTPDANFNGVASFSYTASDGAATSNSATATVNVAAVNDAPVANADTLAATEDTPVTYTAAQLLGNDTDVEGSALTVDSVSGGAGGTAVLNGNGTVTFTPNANFNGVASFSYTASDGAATSNSATATVNVAAVNDAPVANADTLAATEDTPVTYTAAQLLGNDTDVEGSALTVDSVTSGAGGTAVLNGDGTVTFTPNANFNGVASFSYTASDGAATSNSATATVNVAAVNDAPGANADTLAATEDTPITYTAAQLLGNDTDVEGSALTVDSVTSGAGGTAVLNGNGTVTFTPNANFNGVASFSYTASDGAATSNSATATVNVAAVNDAPGANADTLAATEDTPITYTAAQLLGNDTDVEGSALTVDSVTSGAGGTAVLNGDGTVTFTPNANFNGAASFTYTASDGALSSNSATATVNVAAVNDAPVANADTLAATEDTPVTYTAAQLLGNDTDVEGSALTVDSVTSGAGGTAVLNGDGTVTFTPNANFNGVASFSYKASDGAATSNSATVTVNVAAVNDAPVANADTLAATEDTPVTYTAAQLLGNDSDMEGDTLSIASVVSGSNGTVVLNGDGTVTFTPDANFNGVASFSYTASDGAATSNSATATVNVAAVNDAPVANADTLAATEDTPVTYTAAQLLGNDTDVEGSALTVDSVSGGAGGTAVLNGNGTVTFTPDANFNGVASFSYTASDGAATSNSATATVNVAAVNDAPVANADTLAATEDTPVTYTAAQLLGNDSDMEGDTLSIASVVSGSNGTVVLNGDGTVTFTPDANFNGVASFSYTASDGAATSNSATATVNVAAVNDAPVANADTLAATEDTPITYTAAQLLGNDTDVEGDTLTVASVTSGAGGTAVLNGDGTVTFTPNANFNGVASFSYTASDGAATSNSATATVNVAAVNDAPVANADTLAATEDTPVTYTAAQLLGNDTDVEGDTLTVASVTSGAGGTAVLNGDGTVTFTPNANFNGVASFSYTASDGALSSNSATVTVNVAAVNDAPVANADTLAATEDTPVTYTAAQLLGNDTDVEGDTLSIASVASGSNGTVVLNGDGTVTFTPNANFDGAASFSYTASDGALSSNSATATVNVAAVNDAPVANADTLAATEDTPVTYTAAQLLGNDTDVEGSALTVASVSSGAGGTAVLNGDGTVTFTPNANFNGVVNFTYKASDGAATSDSATVTVNVAALIQGPDILPIMIVVTDQLITPALDSGPAATLASTTPADNGLNIAVGTEEVESSLVASDLELTRLAENSQANVQQEQRSVASLGAERRIAPNVDAETVVSDPMMGLRTSRDSNAVLAYDNLVRSLRSQSFIDELDSLRQQVRRDFDLDRTFAVSASGVTLGISVLYVLWLIRGGVLMTSYLMAIPAWRVLDPLPVLSRVEEEDSDDDDDDEFDSAGSEDDDPARTLKGY